MFAALIITLPTQPGAVRLRVWRALKAMGCAALRDGAYLLPEAHAGRFEPLAEDARAHGGTAGIWSLAPRSEQQAEELAALFDRSAAYAQWREQAVALADALPTLTEVEARRRFRGLADALQALRDTDYFPGPAATQAEAELQALRGVLDQRFSRGEPRPRAAEGIVPLDPRRFQGKRWATRARPWVDRLACAWLIRRFIDAEARFLWLADPAGSTPPPRGTLGFDYDGARFTHVGPMVSFEVLAASFGLDADPALARLARCVRFLDTGGIPVPEAAGLEAVLAGLRELHTDDDRLLDAAVPVFDALHAVPEGRR